MKFLFKILPLFTLLISITSIGNVYSIEDDSDDDIDININNINNNHHHVNNNNIPINWYLERPNHNEPDWIYEYSGTDDIQGLHLRQSYSRMFAYYCNMTKEHRYYIRFNISGLATDRSINQWQIDRYQILKRIQNQDNTVASNQPMNYYLYLLRILINSTCQLKDDIKNGLYINDLDPNLNERGLISYEGAAYRLQAICRLIINKMLLLVKNTDQQRSLLDFQADFSIFHDLNNDQLEHIYRRLRHAIKQNNNQ